MEELYGKFNDTLFIERNHTYKKGGKILTSVTTMLKEFQEPFEEDYWALWTALKESGNNIKIWQFKPDKIDYTPFLTKTVEEVKEDWKLKREEGCKVGTSLHQYLEGLWGRKILAIDNNHERYKTVRSQANKFYMDFKDRYEPIKMECVISNSFLGGQIDGLFYDKVLKGVVIIDYKNDKEIKYENKYTKFKAPIDHLDDCNYNKYCLQVSTYKKIFEEETGIPIVDVKIIWFNKDSDTYEIIEPKLLMKEIELLWQVFQKQ